MPDDGARDPGLVVSLWAVCESCDYRDRVDDDLPAVAALRRAHELTRLHALTEHFQLVAPPTAEVAR